MADTYEDVAGLRVGSVVTDLAALVDGTIWDYASDTVIRTLIDSLARFVRAEEAIDLRIARLLAWIRTRDLSELGYPSWRAFVREELGRSVSWVNDKVRLVNSDLDLIKHAVCQGLVPISVACLTPGQVSVDDQEAWLVRAISGEVQTRVQKRRAVGSDVISGDDAELVQRARALARMCMGWRAPVARVDAWILQHWRNRTPARVILEQAREPAPRPGRLDEVASWCDLDDPATELVGEWTEPTDLAGAVRRLRALTEVQCGRKAVIGKAFALISFHYLHLTVGYESLEELATRGLGISLRSCERYKKLGWDLILFPRLEAALAQGLDVGRAMRVAEVAQGVSMGDWIELARRVGRTELARATARAREIGGSPQVRREYAELAARADQATANGRLPEPDATANGRPEVDTTIEGPVRVALRDGAPAPRPPGVLHVAPGLVEAARWLIETVEIPKGRGIRATASRDGYTCTNPECRRQSLGVQVHHLRMRSMGGDDSPRNLITLCRACHLRLRHGGRLQVWRSGDWLVWRYPRGRAVLMWDPVPR